MDISSFLYKCYTSQIISKEFGFMLLNKNEHAETKEKQRFFYWAPKKTKKFFLLTRAAQQALEVIIIMMKIHEGRASEGEYLLILIMEYFITNKKLT